jgi:GNAT superfamily N-acetyltransferase
MARNYKKGEKSGSGSSTKKWMARNYFKPGDIGYLTYLHGKIYAKEYGYDQTFEAYVAKGLVEFVQSFNPKKDIMWLAAVDNHIIGAIAVVGHSKVEAQLRWFLVHPDYRRQGLGSELMNKALKFCKECKYKTVFLWTTSDLHAAGRLYTCAGFKKVEDKTHEIWGKKVTEERYELQV